MTKAEQMTISLKLLYNTRAGSFVNKEVTQAHT
jgi:hypothetical protein